MKLAHGDTITFSGATNPDIWYLGMVQHKHQFFGVAGRYKESRTTWAYGTCTIQDLLERRKHRDRLPLGLYVYCCGLYHGELL